MIVPLSTLKKRYSKALFWLAVIVLFIGMFHHPAYAQFTIVGGNTRILTESLSVNAQCDLKITPDVEDALENGIELHFIFQYRLFLVRPFIWDSRIADWQESYVLKYHSLSDQYLLINSKTKEHESFVSTREAMDSFANIRTRLPAITKTLPQNESGYRMGMRVSLDKNKIPSPLKLIVEISPSWDLDSTWHIWPVSE